MSFILRAASPLFAAVLLASCSALSPAPPLSSSPTVGSNAARPAGFFATYVKVNFHNATPYKLNVITAYSYPIIPGWVTYEKHCVHPNTDWTSEMGFDFPDPQVLIAVHNDDCRLRQPIGSGRLTFKDIAFFEDRATITSQVTYEAGPLDFCARQTHPINGKRECVKIKNG